MAKKGQSFQQYSLDVNMEGVILHSDQGFQYTSKPFNRKLKRLGTWEPFKAWKLPRQCLYRILLSPS